MDIRLTHYDARLMIEALKELESKWRHINENSPDEDERADYGNDLAALYASKKNFVETARAAFGDSIIAFDETPL